MLGALAHLRHAVEGGHIVFDAQRHGAEEQAVELFGAQRCHRRIAVERVDNRVGGKGSDFDVLPNIPAKLHRPTVLGAIRLLRLVADVDNGEVQGEAVR